MQHAKRSRGTLAGVVGVGVLAGVAGQCRASIAGPGPATFTFTGNATINPETVNTTANYAGETAITSPTLVYPELDTPTATNINGGFESTGRFDFTSGSASAVEVTITASVPLTVTTAGTIYTASAENGFFGIDSGDAAEINGTSTPAVSAILNNFSTATQLIDASSNDITGTDSSAAGVGDGIIPLTASDFPDGGLNVEAGPATSGAGIDVPAGNYTLLQTVTIDISGLLPAESVDIDLPAFSTINTTNVPEPASLAMLATAALLIRRRGRDVRD